jgi:hypothetical protein
MPGNTVTIKADQRQAIYQLVRAHLGGLSDVCLALGNEDFASAERLGREFGEDFRLLADLGWEENDNRAVILTMPARGLVKVLERLRAEAAEGFIESPDERRLTEEERETKERYRLIMDTCDELTSKLGPRGGE